jgi:hypothetical protein
MTDFISPFAADMIGFAGSFCIVAAYAYSNASSAMNMVLFNAANFVGAALLTISLLVNLNPASLVLEFFWAAIAIWGLVKALRSRGISA